ncbi:MAG: 7TM-DISM domain-containing protein, partial [Hyphomicrobium sp.]|nr:7TM-DISM domain-containing protein [Hyphomicrobium sp.]
MALKPIVIEPDRDRVEVTNLGEFYDARGDSLQVETAPAADGMTGRISVTAKTPGTSPNWVVFALTNPTDKPVERWLTAERYNIIGSGAVWPDLDAQRIEVVTPSMGYIPERIKSDRADIFRITIEPGQTVTYVAELASDRFARLYLWKPLEYELYSRDRLLMNGIMLGLTGLLAIFLTAIFAANHKAIFPSAALVSWCVLAYLCVDFGFFHKLFQLKPEDNAVYRAASESAVAASLVIFISVFLRIAFWHGLIRMLFTVWIIAQLTLVAVAVIDPRLASTF